MHIHRTGTIRLLAVSAVICTFLASCTTQTGAPIYFPGGTSQQAKPVYGLERGARFESMLSGNDREALARAAGDLLALGQQGGMRPWDGGSGNSGQLRLGTTYLMGLDASSGAPVPAPAGIDASVPLAPASGNYVTTNNANVRLGPMTSAIVSQTLNEGTTVRAYGHDPVGDWYLIGVADAVLGYVSGQLLTPTSGGDPVLAGGAPRRPRLCRDVDISLTSFEGHTESWLAFVCQGPDGWLVPSERGLT